MAGPIASGKTSLADALARVVDDCCRSTFSQALRSMALAERVDVTDRTRLQNYGSSVAVGRWQELWDVALRIAVPVGRSNLIVDGLRHVHIYDAVKAAGDLKVGLLALLPAEDVIGVRMSARGEDGAVMRHRVESEWRSLGAAAHVVLRGRSAESPGPESVARLFAWLWS